ncbi:alpha-1,2-fucosyltransferase [Methylomonas methanica]|uniref:Glycosyl transferase family 11 n=1 Tax=Methylomonas methanica TaxID=421 RepID=A0A177MQ79_METMH|nr:alpha-1,2-fucosyltransferase [Methylomonas methanica]OAI07544.1 hypothetical protein A1332_08655 [Methylomonas methanica]
MKKQKENDFHIIIECGQTKIMIVVRLTGGLGNQMFQYAAGKSLSYLHNTILSFDTSYFNNQKLRQYSLSTFNIQQHFIAPTRIKVIRPPFFEVKKFFHDQSSHKKTSIFLLYKENSFTYDTNFNKQPSNTYLDGYWQSEKYFTNIEHIIRQDLTFNNIPDSKNLQLINKIESSNSISIHIRRGDYVSSKQANEYHGTCGISYYNEAIKKMSTTIIEPHFFAFSDEPAWAHENIKTDYPLTIIDHNESEHEDLRLMSLCKHNIIANSTFSWWAAWLNNNKSKIVIAPAKWFRATELSTQDLIPNSWIQL